MRTVQQAGGGEALIEVGRAQLLTGRGHGPRTHGAVIFFPGTVEHPPRAPDALVAIHAAMSEEARADLLAYARGRLRRDRG